MEAFGLNPAYRQKLLHWFCSMLALLLMTALAATSFWFLRAPEIVAYGPPYVMANIAGSFGESFLGYYLYFFPVAFWHLLDFLERTPGRSLWGRRLTRYRIFAAFMGISQVGFVLVASAQFNKSYCPDFDIPVYHYQCTVGPAEWLYFFWLAPLLLACALAMAKFLRLIFIRFIWD